MEDEDGKTAVDIAREEGHTETERYLMKMVNYRFNLEMERLQYQQQMNSLKTIPPKRRRYV